MPEILKIHHSDGFEHHARNWKLHGRDFFSIYLEARRMLFDDDDGIIRNGRIWRAVEAFLDWDPDSPMSPVGFNRNHAEKFLYFGRFEDIYVIRNLPFGREGLQGVALTGPPREHIGEGIFGEAIIGRGRIWLNMYDIRNQVRDAPEITNKTRRIDAWVFRTAAVLLHEVMHCAGFTHGSAQRAPDSAYKRTLPEVAERAVYQQSPLWDPLFAGAYSAENAGTHSFALAGCACGSDKLTKPLDKRIEEGLPVTECGFQLRSAETDKE